MRVQHQQNVALELARLALQRDHAADRPAAGNGFQPYPVGAGELTGQLQAVVPIDAPVVDQQHPPWQAGLHQ